MKKTTFLAAVAVVASLASCTAQSPKANLNTEIDSLSYAIGMSRTEGLMQHLIYQMQVDTTYMNDFMKGFNEGANKTSAKDNAYLAGIQIGQLVGIHWINQLNQQMFAGDSTMQISKDNMIAGFVAGVNGKTNIMTMQQAQTYQQTESERIVSQATEKKFADNKAAGEQFLAENKNKEGVVTTESGLQYKIITQGRGAIPTESSKVRVNYKGTLIDGTEFDSSSRHGSEPATFQPNQVIKGWTEALTMMPVGSKWELYIPQELAYGSRDSGQIKPFSALIFEVELVGIDK